MIRKGPFDLFMGMTKEEIEGPLEEISPFKFTTQTVPKPHSAFELYALQITPHQGLSWIKAIGKSMTTSVYGVELKSAFESMESKLSNAYGKQQKLDFLMAESIWNEPRDWMQGILNKERRLLAFWNAESNATLSDSLVSVYLGATAIDTSTGFLTVEYEFKNNESANAAIAALEDDAL